MRYPTEQNYRDAVAIGKADKPWTSDELAVRHQPHGSEVRAVIDGHERVTVAWCGRNHNFMVGEKSVMNSHEADAQLFALAPQMAKALLMFCELHYDNPKAPAGLDTYLAPVRDQIAAIMSDAEAGAVAR